MKRKIVNGIEIVFLIASTFAFKAINVVTKEYHTLGNYITDITNKEDMLWDVLQKQRFLYPILALYFIAILFCIISVFANKKHKDSFMQCIIVIMIEVLTNLSMASFMFGYHITNHSAAVRFEILLLIALILSIIKRSDLVLEKQTNKTQENSSSSADELKKYKDLLDSGAITQEEFDTKKQKLLNL